MECLHSSGLAVLAAIGGSRCPTPLVHEQDPLVRRCGSQISTGRCARPVLGDLPTGSVERVVTETGSMAVSCRELTAVDLAATPALAGGFDSVASVLAELGDLDTDVLGVIGCLYPRSVIRRLGWLLDEVVGMRGLEPLERLAAPDTGNITPLDGHAAPTGQRHQTWGTPEVPCEIADPPRRRVRGADRRGVVAPSSRTRRWSVVSAVSLFGCGSRRGLRRGR